MADFFDYRSHYRTGIYYDLTTVEWLLPIALIIMIAILMIVYREKLRGNIRLDRNIRLYGGIFFMVIYLSHYALRFSLYGFDYLLLPFQLCSISMFFAIVLIFTKNKTIFNFVLYTGVLGGFISIFVPIIGYDSSFYRYYQYELAHGLLILTPIYFVVVHDYLPSKMETVYSFLILQGIGVFMVIFNYYAGTDYMFIFINADKIEKFPMIAKFGGIPLYLLWVEIAGITAYFIEFQIIHFFYKSKKVKEEIILNRRVL